MAQLVYTDAFISIDATDLSDHCKSLTINYEAEMLDDTVMSDTTRTNFPGLLSWSVDVDFLQDYAASNVDATLFPLVGSTTVSALIMRPTSAGVSATNPEFTGNAYLSTYPPMTGAVGDLETISATFVAAGALARAEA